MVPQWAAIKHARDDSRPQTLHALTLSATKPWCACIDANKSIVIIVSWVCFPFVLRAVRTPEWEIKSIRDIIFISIMNSSIFQYIHLFYLFVFKRLLEIIFIITNFTHFRIQHLINFSFFLPFFKKNTLIFNLLTTIIIMWYYPVLFFILQDLLFYWAHLRHYSCNIVQVITLFVYILYIACFS